MEQKITGTHESVATRKHLWGAFDISYDDLRAIQEMLMRDCDVAIDDDVNKALIAISTALNTMRNRSGVSDYSQHNTMSKSLLGVR